MPVIAKLINPFISATIDLLATMADMTATRKDLFLKKNYRLAGDVSGIMNITGRMEGSVAVTLERGLALEIVSRILHSPASELTEEDIKDGVGELVNIISGNAKASLAGTEYAHEITLPAVIIGYGHEISHPRGAPCIVALFESGAHTFGVQVSVQVKK
ncbi:MAG: hypothetical protein A2293_13650 [Elusimicrobia bacterium RIFOXYB2_FULL_49_7]|nr:MAG: hypothetical protein A2293_13650 [Elusimicrobia bacterium RIFOXYB2_FULL_49_7]